MLQINSAEKTVCTSVFNVILPEWANWKKMQYKCHRQEQQNYSVRLCLSNPLLGNLIILIILLFMYLRPWTVQSKFGNGISLKPRTESIRSITLEDRLA